MQNGRFVSASGSAGIAFLHFESCILNFFPPRPLRPSVFIY
jgi:hypothetical protein